MRFILQCMLILLLATTGGLAQVRGVSLAHLHARGFGYGSDECRKQLDALREMGCNWISITGFAYMPDVNSPGLRFGGDRSMRENDFAQTVKDAHDRQIKVMIKPHLWSRQFGEGKSPTDVKMSSEADWDAWFDAYGRYVVQQAKMAQDAGADGFCVGVELQGTSTQTARWKALIADVRKVFKGELTYAAAFEEWHQIEFWGDLDCVGINAYFKLADVESPDEATIRSGWDNVYARLDVFAQRIGKPICFTEIGYTACVKAAQQPWSWDMTRADPDLQARLYRIALAEASKREYVKGVFVWKWFTSDRWAEMEHGDEFGIQDRPMVVEALRACWKK